MQNFPVCFSGSKVCYKLNVYNCRVNTDNGKFCSGDSKTWRKV